MACDAMEGLAVSDTESASVRFGKANASDTGSAWNSELQGSSSPQRRSGALTPTNVGFKLLQKSGWKEGSGLGVAEQGRLEPLDVFVKNDKQGIGAYKVVKQKTDAASRKTHENHSKQESEGNGKSASQKNASKRLRKELAREKQLQEQRFQRDFFREFLPDNI